MSGGVPHETRNKKPTKFIFHNEREGRTCGSMYRQVIPVADRGRSSHEETKQKQEGLKSTQKSLVKAKE